VEEAQGALAMITAGGAKLIEAALFVRPVVGNNPIRPLNPRLPWDFLQISGACFAV
jgi:hypothetical protein